MILQMSPDMTMQLEFLLLKDPQAIPTQLILAFQPMSPNAHVQIGCSGEYPVSIIFAIFRTFEEWGWDKLPDRPVQESASYFIKCVDARN